MFEPLDGPAKQFVLVLTSTTVQEAKGDTTALEERKIITLLPTDGKIWVYFGDGDSTPSAADVKSMGFPHTKNSLRSYEASKTQPVYVVADSDTVDVRGAERA